MFFASQQKAMQVHVTALAVQRRSDGAMEVRNDLWKQMISSVEGVCVLLSVAVEVLERGRMFFAMLTEINGGVEDSPSVKPLSVVVQMNILCDVDTDDTRTFFAMSTESNAGAEDSPRGARTGRWRCGQNVLWKQESKC